MHAFKKCKKFLAIIKCICISANPSCPQIESKAEFELHCTVLLSYYLIAMYSIKSVISDDVFILPKIWSINRNGKYTIVYFLQFLYP